ncbi:MAG TPA: lysophospholipid acyltransferase family protein [Alphaproteobacteria bacterium]|nr:lysophospholipid acyltransferase family protein [Alphaproteobacteria bacterium]
MDRWEFKPAGDLGLSWRERLTSLRRETGLLGLLTRHLWRGVLRLYFGLWHRLRVEGAENLPREAPFIVIANHASHLDALALSIALPPRFADCIFPLAAGDTFFTGAGSSTFAAIALNALPIWRRKTRPEHLATLRGRLREQACIYILFPEGTRSRDGMMAAFKPGLGCLVAGTLVPVVPCHIDGAFAAFPPHARLPRARRIVIRVGAPLHFADQPNDRAGWHAIAAAAETAVRGLASPRLPALL